MRKQFVKEKNSHYFIKRCKKTTRIEETMLLSLVHAKISWDSRAHSTNTLYQPLIQFRKRNKSHRQCNPIKIQKRMHMTLLNRSKLLENRKDKDDAAARESFSYKARERDIITSAPPSTKKGRGKSHSLNLKMQLFPLTATTVIHHWRHLSGSLQGPSKHGLRTWPW